MVAQIINAVGIDSLIPFELAALLYVHTTKLIPDETAVMQLGFRDGSLPIFCARTPAFVELYLMHFFMQVNAVFIKIYR